MECDVIILSSAANQTLKDFTRQAVRSLLLSEKPGTFNVIVLEQATWKYNNAATFHMPGELNYNAFANFAFRKTSLPWVCIANNDVFFKRGWFSALMKYKYPVMSPKSPGNSLQEVYKQPAFGFNVQEHFSGWCFVINREIYNLIGGFDESFPFYCADNMVVNQLKQAGITPALIPDSRVIHFLGKTRKMLPPEKRIAITEQERVRYHKLQSKDRTININEN